MSERFTAVFAVFFALAVLAPVLALAAVLPVKGDAHAGDQSSNIRFDLSPLQAGPVSSDASNATLYLFVNHIASTGSLTQVTIGATGSPVTANYICVRQLEQPTPPHDPVD